MSDSYIRSAEMPQAAAENSHGAEWDARTKVAPPRIGFQRVTPRHMLIPE